jgi:hypothetical protein
MSSNEAMPLSSQATASPSMMQERGRRHEGGDGGADGFLAEPFE